LHVASGYRKYNIKKGNRQGKTGRGHYPYADYRQPETVGSRQLAAEEPEQPA